VRTLRANDPVPLEQALVATGFGYSPERRAAQARVAASVIPVVRDIRRAGACSLDLCHLAAGRLDGYYERGPQAWDLAAGGLVAHEAGARVEGLHGAPPGPDMIVAAGPALFRPLASLLESLDADRD
jgi:myo-inositol-1(or 4)-monophosphatase